MNWPNPTRFLTLTLAAMMVAMFQFVPTRSWACSAGGATAFSHSAESDASTLTVCVKSVASTKAVAPAKPAPAPVTKPVQPAKPAPVVKPAPKPTPKQTPSPTAKSTYFTPPKAVFVIPFAPVVTKPTPKVTATPKPVPKVTPAPKPTVKPSAPAARVTVSTATAEARFAPASLVVSASDLAPGAGNSVDFAVDAGLHFRSATLLGKTADVSFTPTSTSWIFGDGSTATGLSVSHIFSRTGAFVVQASQSYEASYRIAGETSWVSGGEVIVQGLVTVTVQRGSQPTGATPPKDATSKLVLLVGKNCIGRTQSFGCQP